ncbi:MAG TPA: hypothetical protein VF267_03480 [Gammaproteobacteria bacterium]
MRDVPAVDGLSLSRGAQSNAGLMTATFIDKLAAILLARALHPAGFHRAIPVCGCRHAVMTDRKFSQ